MKSRNIGGTFAAAALAFGIAAVVEVPSHAQTPAGAPAQASQERTGTEQQVTVTGCIQRESDYRKARDAGRGGAAGTGVGAGNEFVLANASTATSAGTTGTPAGAATGTAGATAPSTAYELTGPNESKAAQHVGRRVEIAGKLKPAEVAASGKPTGGATAGKPPEGVDVAAPDLMLREIEVSTIREVSGTCPGGV